MFSSWQRAEHRKSKFIRYDFPLIIFRHIQKMSWHKNELFCRWKLKLSRPFYILYTIEINIFNIWINRISIALNFIQVFTRVPLSQLLTLNFIIWISFTLHFHFFRISNQFKLLLFPFQNHFSRSIINHNS